MAQDTEYSVPGEAYFWITQLAEFHWSRPIDCLLMYICELTMQV
jgi:hypothetical protein